MPLGEAYSGTCRARPDEFHAPGEDHQREVCNCGYARGACDRFPGGGDAPDAVRFSAGEPESGLLSVTYVFEKDHAPQRHGTLQYSISEQVFAATGAGTLLLRQARAFIESYLASRAV